MRTSTSPIVVAIVFLLAVALCSASADAPALPTDLSTRQQAADADANNWLLYGRNYQAWRYSPLTQIDKGNVKSLQVVWQMDTGMHNGFEATPIVVDGVMYFSTPWNHVLAVDAATGDLYWRYVYQMVEHPILCCDAINRGVGIGSGKVVMGTLDARIVAIDARTGKEVWVTQVDEPTMGYSISMAPQIIGNKAIVGVSGGEYGIRGHIDAYDLDTGKLVWRFYTIPGPGEPGNDTWAGDSWKTGGAPNWMTCTYDPAMNTLFAGIGNTCPDLDGSKRAGINLYADSVVALDADTGKLKWYYQTVPHDVWDLDATVCPVIDDITIDGRTRKVVMFAPKNGYFYVLDRTDGKPIYALRVADQVTWGTVSADGATVTTNKDVMPVENEWRLVAPAANGGKEWCNVAYDPKLKRIFIPLLEEPLLNMIVPQPIIPGLYLWGGFTAYKPSAYGHITAVDVEKRSIAWDARTTYPHMCSMTATAAGLVITGMADGKMVVMDADNGRELWSQYMTSGWHAGAVSYAVNGKQYIGFANGWGGLPQGVAAPMLEWSPKINTMYVLGLP